MISFYRNRLFSQVYISIVFLTVFLMIVAGYLVLNEQQKSILDVMRTQAQTIAKSIELVSADAMVTDDQSFLVEHNLNVLDHTPSIRFILISKNRGGTLLTKKQQWWLTESIPPELKPFETQDEAQQIIANPFDDAHEEVYYYVYPLNFDGIEWGWIHIGFSLDDLTTTYNNMYRKMAIIFGIIFIVISILIYFITRKLINPIVALSHATKKMAQGDMNVQLSSVRQDEIGELTQNFNIMAEALRESQTQLINSNVILEKKVEERTRELEEINRTLDERVREEISRRREQEQILIQQSRFAAMGEMIGNIAHQWRQPLNALSLLIQNITHAYHSGRLDEAFIQRVNEKGLLLTASMSQTIDDFRNFFKPNRNMEHFDVAEQTSKALQMVQATLSDHQIEVILSMQTELMVYGFPNEFSQVLLNIFNNAKDALIASSVPERLIGVNGYHENGVVRLDISDNAGGIDAAIIDKIFDPYFTTKEEGKGTGIGLYMSKVIIETNMHGKLYVGNTGEGAMFSILLGDGGER